jgi:hypothetical protein
MQAEYTCARIGGGRRVAGYGHRPCVIPGAQVGQVPVFLWFFLNDIICSQLCGGGEGEGKGKGIKGTQD